MLRDARRVPTLCSAAGPVLLFSFSTKKNQTVLSAFLFHFFHSFFFSIPTNYTGTTSYMSDDDNDDAPLLQASPSNSGIGIRAVPLTILTGYLGSGKSTIVNRILHSPSHGLRIMVIENEIADGIGNVKGGQVRAGIEGMLIRSDPLSPSPSSAAPAAAEEAVPNYEVRAI